VTASAETPRAASVVDGFLRSPLSGLAPWIVLSVFSGPGRFEEAAAGALGLAVLVGWLGHRRGIRIHLLEAFTVAYFAVLAIVGLFASDDQIRWLETWSGEVSNIALVVFAVVTLAIRQPFTLAYARDSTPREVWDSPLFYRINVVISAVWAGSFAVNAVLGGIGDAVLHDSGNFWTGWILQLASTFFAVAFTEHYPDHATADSEPPAQSLVAGLVDWIPVFVLITGIAGLVTESVDTWLGVTLIVAGSVGGGLVRRLAPPKR
jgi:hypothetical protein